MNSKKEKIKNCIEIINTIKLKDEVFINSEKLLKVQVILGELYHTEK